MDWIIKFIATIRDALTKPCHAVTDSVTDTNSLGSGQTVTESVTVPIIQKTESILPDKTDYALQSGASVDDIGALQATSGGDGEQKKFVYSGVRVNEMNELQSNSGGGGKGDITPETLAKVQKLLSSGESGASDLDEFD